VISSRCPRTRPGKARPSAASRTRGGADHHDARQRCCRKTRPLVAIRWMGSSRVLCFHPSCVPRVPENVGEHAVRQRVTSGESVLPPIICHPAAGTSAFETRARLLAGRTRAAQRPAASS
jgi:hypothetical protein